MAIERVGNLTDLSDETRSESSTGNQRIKEVSIRLRYLLFYNISDAVFWLNLDNEAAPDTAGSFPVNPGESWRESEPGFVPNGAIYIYCAATGKKYTLKISEAIAG